MTFDADYEKETKQHRKHKKPSCFGQFKWYKTNDAAIHCYLCGWCSKCKRINNAS